MTNKNLAQDEQSARHYHAGSLSLSLLFIAMLLVLFLTALELIASISLILGLNVAVLNAPLAMLVTVATGFISARSFSIRREIGIIAIVCCVVIITLAMAVAASFYDHSYDGQAYHQEAILQLANGWNPYYDTLAPTVHEQIWLTHYPKGPWYQANSFYALTGSIESGKATNLILIAMSGFFVASLLFAIPRLPAWLCVAVTVLSALNPVSLNQALTFYVDGQLASIFISLVAVLAAAAIQPNKYTLASAAALMLLLINIKFTGLAYEGLIALGFGFASLYLHKMLDTFRYSSIIASGILAGFFVIGYAPYAHNALDNGHIFYPLRGDNSIDIMSHAKPEPLRSMNRLQAAAVSLFSESSNSTTEYKLKLPLHIPNGRELREASASEARLGGFGPWFSGAFCGGLILIIAGFVGRSNGAVKRLAAYLLFFLAVTVFINPEAWWARYVPQLFLLPLLGCLLACTTKSIGLRLVAGATIATLFLNLGMIAYFGAKANGRLTQKIDSQLLALKQSNRPVIAHFSVAPSLRARFEKHSIGYTSVSEEGALPCAAPKELVGGHGAKYCFAESRAKRGTNG